MKKQITKEVTACDYCEREIDGQNNHRFADAQTGDVFDLHADCMKKAVMESIRARKGYNTVAPCLCADPLCRGDRDGCNKIHRP